MYVKKVKVCNYMESYLLRSVTCHLPPNTGKHGPALTPAMQAGIQYSGGTQDWVGPGDW